MTAFPPRPPSSLTDRDEIVRNDWAAYSALVDLTDHWSRPAWPDGTEAHYWLLALGDQPELRGRAAECQRALQGDVDLVPVPVDLLHLTLIRVGPIDANTTDLSELAANAARRLAGTGPIPLTVGPLAGSAGAVRFSVSPWDRLLRIHAELAAAAHDVLGERPTATLRPHISIAYNGRRRPARPVIAAVRDLREEPPLDVAVSNIHLVALRRQGRLYKWTTNHVVAL